MMTPNLSTARRAFSSALLLLVALPCLLAAKDTVIRGRLAQPSGQNPSSSPSILFTTDDGQTLVLVGDDYSASQLADPELRDRYWELRGNVKPDGVFDVLRLFTIKDGRLFRVTYFCVICNIRSHHHAPCMCCQDETELQELPVDAP